MSLATLGFSQGPSQQRPKRPSAEEMIKKATIELDLSPDQVKSWKEIHIKYANSEADRKKADESRATMTKELEGILDEAQKEKFEKMRAGQGPPPKGGGGR